MAYDAPTITELGSVRDFTLASPTFNKVGPHTDQYSAATGGAVIGSIVPVK